MRIILYTNQHKASPFSNPCTFFLLIVNSCDCNLLTSLPLKIYDTLHPYCSLIPLLSSKFVFHYHFYLV